MSDQARKGVIAYGVTPHAGGTTIVYRLLAQGLRSQGWKVFSIAMGESAALAYDPDFGDEYSVILAPEETTLAGQVKAFLEWAEREKVDIVIPNCEENILAAIPHLPPRIRYFSVCHTVARVAYLLSRIHLNRVSYVIAVSNRQIQSLERRWKVPRAKLRLIPHGIEYEKFFKGNRSRPNASLRLIYFGRIEDMDKGVLWLPAILKKISDHGIPFFMDIVGAGPDLMRLQEMVEGHGLSPRVRFHGQAPPTEIPRFLSQTDVSLIPSRFEGFGLTLVEAMAAGCVPIATHLGGITDMIVEDGVNGFLCPMGDTNAFANKIISLQQEPNRLAEMSRAAQERVKQKFSLQRMASDYDALFTQGLSEPPVDYTPRPLDQLAYPQELRPTWRTWVPLPFKNLARKVLYRYFGYIP
ncbi:MAG: glycosyltransferase family 4 protein [Thermodesulfobacteriota bacterium]